MSIRRPVLVVAVVILINLLIPALLNPAPLEAQTGACAAEMISYHKLDEASNPYTDQLGGPDMTCSNCPTAAAGIVAGAQQFDGANDEVALADDGGQFDWAADDSFTIEYWMKKATVCTGNEVIVGRDATENNLHWWTGCDGNGTVRFQLQDTTGTGLYLGGTGDVINDGTWHHLVFVRDESIDENRVYVDGQQTHQGTQNYTAGFGSTVPVDIGYLNLGGHYRYDGLVDEIAFYDKALSLTEIQEHYNAGSGVIYCTVAASAPVISSTAVTEAYVGKPYSYDVAASGSPAPTFELLVSPAGMTIDTASGLIEWTPTATGDYDVEVQAENSEGTDSQSYILSVTEAPPFALRINSGGSTIVDGAYTWESSAGYVSGGADYTFSTSSVNTTNNGIVDPVPPLDVLKRCRHQSPHTYNFPDVPDGDYTVRILWTDQVTAAGLRQIDYDIEGVRILEDWDIYAEAGGQFVAVEREFDVTVSSAEGAGLQIVSSTASGDAFESAIEIVARQDAAPLITSTAVTTATVGAPYSYDVEASGTPAPTFSLTLYPAGMTIDPDSGVISWTPAAPGDVDVTVRAENSVDFDTQDFTITVSEAGACAVSIMPLGDSNTEGVTGSTQDVGYRRSLWLSLDALGYDVAFVGGVTTGLLTDFDRDHEGHGGWHANQIRDNVNGFLTANPADIVVLHIGTNDVSGGQSAAGIAVEIDEILTNIYSFDSDTMVILGRIINRTGSTEQIARTSELNGLIQDLAETRIGTGDNLLVADVESALIYPADMADPVHPNDGGYDKMAGAWLGVLQSYLPAHCASGPTVHNLSLTATSPQNLTSDDLICSYGLAGGATTAATAWYKDASPQMLLHMPFEGGATNALLDYSGSGNDGVTIDDPTWAAAGGFDDHGYFAFDGNDYIDAGNFFPTGAYTKAAWVKWSGDPAFEFNNIISGQTNHAFWVHNTGGQFKLTSGHNGAWDTVVDPALFPIDTWTFTAITFDSGTMNLYRDGGLTPVASASGVPDITSDTKVFIGTYNNDCCSMKGDIDEVRIYDFALSPQQLQKLYEQDHDRIVAQETAPGEEWQCRVTPFDAAQAGTTDASNPLTIDSGDPPAVDSVALASSSGSDLTSDDLTCSYNLTGGATTAGTAWLKNGAPNMVLYAPMEGGAANALLDYSGSGSDGTQGPGASWSANGGLDGHGAFSFNGADNAYIDVGSAMPSGAYTKAVWLYATDTSDCHNIISGDYSNAIFISGGSVQAGHNGGWTNHVRDTAAFPLNSWTHVAVSYDPAVATGQMILHRDGSPVSTNDSVPLHDCPTCPDPAQLWLGAFNNSTDTGATHCTWNGRIDDARVYDYALSGGQIAALYGGGAGDANTIDAAETVVGESWQCQVTPFSAAAAGTAVDSNTITINAANLPGVDNVLLSSTSGNDYTEDDLTCSYDLTGSTTRTGTAWIIDGTPQMALFMPMEGGSGAEGLVDRSGSGASPSNNGATWGSGSGYNGTGAFYFEDDTINAGEILLANGSYTKMAWVKPTADDTNNILSGDNTGTSHAFWANCGPNTISFGGGHGGQWCDVEESFEPTYGDWYHVALTYDAGDDTLRLYRDGAEVGTGTASQGDTNDATIMIGGYGDNHEWRGYLDDARVYNFILSEEQIAAIYNHDGDVIDAVETSVGQEWQCQVTPFDDSEAGTAVTSNLLTIQAAQGSSSITINKSTTPAGGTGFQFAGSLGGFTLDDGGSQPFTALSAGNYDVTEIAAAGWKLADITCSGSSVPITDGVTISLGADENVSCTFTNEELMASACPVETIVYYQLEEVAAPFADLFGGTNATCTNCPTWAAGQVGFGQSFDGIDDEVLVVDDNDQFDWALDDSFTIEYWMKKSATCDGNEVIVGRDDSSSDLHWWTGCSATGNTAAFQLRDTNNNGIFIGASGQPINDGDWHHLVFVRDESINENRLYIDGAQTHQGTHDYTAGFAGGAAVDIGYLNLSGHFRYDGLLDEVAIYDRALTAAEIAEHYALSSHSVNYCTYSGPPEFITLTLAQSDDKISWADVPGSLGGGFTMALDPAVEYVYLDVGDAATNSPLEPGYHGFMVDSYPAGFFDYWAARGVVEGAAGWQGVMWEIINGNLPIFYLRVTDDAGGQEFMLVDGLQKELGQPDDFLRINGDYHLGSYSYAGVITDTGGRTSTVPVSITFQAPSVCSAEMISYHKLDETSGTTASDYYDGHNGDLYDNPTWTSGQVDGALAFDGVDDRVQVPSSTAYDIPVGGSFSAFTWFQKSSDCGTNQNSQNEVMLNRTYPGQHGSNTWWFGCHTDDKLTVMFFPASSTGDDGIVKSDSVVDDGIWHHGGWVYDGGANELRLYLDGQLQTEVDSIALTADFDSSNPLCIGGYDVDGSCDTYEFNGLLDEVTFYSRTLTAQEIQDNYDTGIGGSPTCELGPAAPEITSLPVTSATVGYSYSYDVEASGSPAPTFSLLQSPTGMTIDENSGLIAWQPDTAGDFDVAVQAGNGIAPPDTQTFIISVAEAGLCPAEMSAYYHLDESSAPYADNFGGAGATCASCPTATAGIVNGAQQFNGASNEVTISDSSDIFDWAADDSFTIEYWMQTTAACTGNQVIVGRDDGSSDLHWWTGCHQDGNTAAFQLRDNNGLGVAIYGQGPAINDGAWHHLVFVRDDGSNENRMYIDGQAPLTVSFDYQNGFESAVPVDVGYLNLSGHYRYEGAIDELAFYDRALTPGEIQAHRDAGLAGQIVCQVGPYAPTITSLPVTQAFVGVNYNYDVTASGSPDPAYSLTENPAGMTINATTGVIQWQPLAAGPVDVTVRAENSQGFDEQSYVIDVLELGACPASMSNYWRLDETSSGSYADSSSSNDGSCAAACPTPTDDVPVEAQVNGGQVFDGETTGINVPADSVFDWAANESFSLEFWMQRPGECAQYDVNHNEVIFGRDDADSQLHWWVGVGCNEQGVAQFRLNDRDGGGDGAFVLSQSKLTGGAWHHVVAVRDAVAGNMSIYVDGRREATAPASFSSGFDSTDKDLNIGWLNLSPGFQFEGILDEMAIYGRALTVTEIKSHYYLSRGYCEGCDTPVRIMPLADSIGWGNASGVVPDSAEYYISWRKDLWDSLIGNGYNVDFIGALQAGWHYAGEGFDSDNAAYPGSTPQGIANMLDTGQTARPGYEGAPGPYLQYYPTDVVLLHIGTNNTGQDEDVETILDEIDEYENLPNGNPVTVVLAQIINRQSYSSATSIFNDQITAMARDRIENPLNDAYPDKIIIVNFEEGTIAGDGTPLNYAGYPSGDMWDNLHPYATGYGKMANTWLNGDGGPDIPAAERSDGLVDFLPVCGPPPAYNLTVDYDGSGTVTLDPPTGPYEQGTTVQLTAVPDSGWNFTGWSGDLSGTENPEYITMNEDKSVTAHFETGDYKLTVETVGDCSVAKEPDRTYFVSGESVTLTASAGLGWTFDGWSGALNDSINPHDLLMDADKTVTATCVLEPYTVTINTVGQGAVAKDPDQTTYHYGDIVELTAVPAAGWRFESWSDDLSGALNPQSLTILGDALVTANFVESNAFYLEDFEDLSPGDDPADWADTRAKNSMSIDDSLFKVFDNSGNRVFGTNSTLKNIHSHYVGGGSDSWSNYRYSGRMQITAADGGIGATFYSDYTNEDVYYRLRRFGTGSFHLSSHGASTQGDLDSGVVPLPDVWYWFVIEVENGLDSTAIRAKVWAAGEPMPDVWQIEASDDSPLRLNSGRFGLWSYSGGSKYWDDLVVEPLTPPETRQLDLTVSGPGSVIKDPDLTDFVLGTTVQLTAVPDTGASFSGWDGALTGTDNPQDLLMDDNKSVSATFVYDEYTLDIAKVGSGTVTKNPDQPTYHYGDLVTLTADPEPGWRFGGWSGDAAGMNLETQLTITGDADVTARFEEGEYTLTVNIVGNCSVTKDPDKTYFNPGETVTLVATPGTGWVFESWSGHLISSNPTEQLLMTEDKTVTATCVLEEYTLTINVVGEGTVLLDPQQATYHYGDSVELTAVPDAGWRFSFWSGGLTGMANPHSLTMLGNATVSATFVESAALYAENFDGMSPGDDPAGWVDTRAKNSLEIDDALFKVFDVDGNMAFGTASTLKNIHSHYNGGDSANWSSYRYSGRMRITAANGGVGVTFYSQFTDEDAYYRLRRYGSNAFHLSTHGTSLEGTLDSGVVPQPDVWYWFVVEVETIDGRTDIRAKVWAAGEEMPLGWQMEASDDGASQFGAGRIGLWSYLSGSKYWDDILVEPLAAPAP